jgi:hypothetical protein
MAPAPSAKLLIPRCSLPSTGEGGRLALYSQLWAQHPDDRGVASARGFLAIATVALHDELWLARRPIVDGAT